MSDGSIHVRKTEEVLSDDHAGASDNAGRTPEILAHVCESAWTSRYSSFACLPSEGKRQWAARLVRG